MAWHKEDQIIKIRSRDYWVKIVEMLQQNWAVVEEQSDGKITVYFITDMSDVFDEIKFDSEQSAYGSLKRNGFKLYAEDKEVQSFLSPPKPPFYKRDHMNNPIYSSGRFWR